MLRLKDSGTLRCGDKIIDLSTPVVMGILNATPDSFYSSSRLSNSMADVIEVAGKMVREGCAILDIGGMSSRPGAKEIPVEEELNRVVPVVKIIQKTFPDTVISIDTYRAKVAEQCIDLGVTIVNDISGGLLDPKMLSLVAERKVAYILMHMRGTPETMQYNADYQDIIPDLLKYFIDRIRMLKEAGLEEVVLDPGFGFSKTPEQNYMLVDQLGLLRFLNLPVMLGVSRKSTLSKTIGRPSEDTLAATTALHMVALQNGASILRVHDVQAAKDTIAVYNELQYVNTLKKKRLRP